MITIPRWFYGRGHSNPNFTAAAPGVAAEVAAAGWSVRINWANGTHSLARFAVTSRGAAAAVPLLRRYWRRCPIRPVCYCVVPVSRHDWHLHARRDDCASPDCPQPTDTPQTPDSSRAGGGAR